MPNYAGKRFQLWLTARIYSLAPSDEGFFIAGYQRLICRLQILLQILFEHHRLVVNLVAGAVNQG